MIAQIGVALLVGVTGNVLGHGGGIDSNGCHNESATGQYHCHSGPLEGQSFASESAALAVLEGRSPSPAATDNSRAYDRDLYGGWIDADGDCQDTRQEILIRQGENVRLNTSGCRVADGVWHGPYTGERFTDPGDLHIDHIVPLAEAHDSGAAAWDRQRKRRFANDPTNLLAVEAGENMSKGRRDPGEWLPDSGRCAYVDRWMEIKDRYGLSMDGREQQVVREVRASCR
jgi:hypothetical protein